MRPIAVLALAVAALAVAISALALVTAAGSPRSSTTAAAVLTRSEAFDLARAAPAPRGGKTLGEWAALADEVGHGQGASWDGYRDGDDWLVTVSFADGRSGRQFVTERVHPDRTVTADARSEGL